MCRLRRQRRDHAGHHRSAALVDAGTRRRATPRGRDAVRYSYGSAFAIHVCRSIPGRSAAFREPVRRRSRLQHFWRCGYPRGTRLLRRAQRHSGATPPAPASPSATPGVQRRVLPHRPDGAGPSACRAQADMPPGWGKPAPRPEREQACLAAARSWAKAEGWEGAAVTPSGYGGRRSQGREDAGKGPGGPGRGDFADTGGFPGGGLPDAWPGREGQGEQDKADSEASAKTTRACCADFARPVLSACTAAGNAAMPSAMRRADIPADVAGPGCRGCAGANAMVSPGMPAPGGDWSVWPLTLSARRLARRHQ